VPIYASKHAFNLLHLDPKIAHETIQSYSLLYHRHPDRDDYRAMFQSYDPSLELPSVEELDLIFDGEE